ncbi:MAG: HlyD family secretion protein [Treponema sp.]|nr:HlyD family secretion protein [Treponema sp.]
MKLYSEQTLPFTQEYFLRKKPEFQQILICIIVLFFLVTFIFLSVAKFEEVIKVTGYIRPEDNISSVSNPVTGRVKSICYKSGQVVKEGELLLEIDPTQYETEKESLLTKISEEEKQLTALYELKDSIEKSINLVNKDNFETYLRYELWRINLAKLYNIKKIKYEKYIQEKKLPSTMTTVSKLHEMESEYLISCNDYDNLYYSFQQDINTEIRELETSKKINEAKIRKIEDSIKFTKICAPINGIIQEVKTFNINDWIQSGQLIFNIIPDNKKYTKVEFTISAKQSGKIEKNMKVKMRFPSLPYHEFGGAEGNIITIDPDITKSQSGDACFIIKTDLNKQYLSDKKGKTYPLKVGLQVDGRIILSKKTIIKYILEKINIWH